MLAFNSICLLGYSGHAHVVLDIIDDMGLHVTGYFNPKEEKNNPYNLKFLGFEQEMELDNKLNENYFFPAIGDNILRKKAIDFIEKHRLSQINLIAATASISKMAMIETSVLVCGNAVINSLAKIEKGSIINSGAIIEHGCIVKKFSHIAPAAVLAGNVKVGENVIVGANAVVKESVVVGDNVIIGAGAVVLSNLPSNSTWVGNPARRIK